MDKEDLSLSLSFPLSLSFLSLLSAIKMNEILPFAATGMELEWIMKSENDKYCIISLVCGI